MATGYTYPIIDSSNEDYRFESFAWHVAEAFFHHGDIPDSFEPSGYHEEQARVLKEEIARLEVMSEVEAERGAQAAHDKALTFHREMVRKRDWEIERFTRMREKVAAWEPPTEAHQPLKAFMLSQIDESVAWGGMGSASEPEPVKLSGQAWRELQLRESRRMEAYHREEYEKDVKRLGAQKAYLEALTQSLGPRPVRR